MASETFMPVAHQMTASVGPSEVIERIDSMVEQLETVEDERGIASQLIIKLQEMRYKVITSAALGAGYVISTGSAALCWTDITSILDGIANYMMPSFLSLVTAAVPLLIILAIVGFIMGFLDKILNMLNLR